jgi:molecular chaperone DnaK
VVQAIEGSMADLRGAMGSEDANAIRDKTSALQQAIMKIGEALNKGAGGASGGSGGAEGDKGQDTEFKEKK